MLIQHRSGRWLNRVPEANIRTRNPRGKRSQGRSPEGSDHSISLAAWPHDPNLRLPWLPIDQNCPPVGLPYWTTCTPPPNVETDQSNSVISMQRQRGLWDTVSADLKPGSWTHENNGWTSESRKQSFSRYFTSMSSQRAIREETHTHILPTTSTKSTHTHIAACSPMFSS